MKKINKKIMETYHRNGWVKLEKFISVFNFTILVVLILSIPLLDKAKTD